MAHDAIKSLEPYAIIGFDGSAPNALKCHPDGAHVVYPMGNKVCVQNWKTRRMNFLSGHTNAVSTVALSALGTYIASGQINHIGFKALTIIWNYEKKTKVCSHELHKVRVEAVAFTRDERYLVSLGGRDCGSVVVWDVRGGSARATAAAAPQTAGDAAVLAPLNRRHNSFITAGDLTLRVWNIAEGHSGLQYTDVSLGKTRRRVTCLTIHHTDSHGYAGTSSGDIIKFSINYPEDQKVNPDTLRRPAILGCLAKIKKGRKIEPKCYSQGVSAIIVLADECLVVGGGDGSVEIVREASVAATKPPVGTLIVPNTPALHVLRRVKLAGCVTSVELMYLGAGGGGAGGGRGSAGGGGGGCGEGVQLVVGTRSSELYALAATTLKPTLVLTCHSGAVNALAFPRNMSTVFATAGVGEIRVWSVETAQELLRIVVANMACSAVLFSHDGRYVLSAWSDGCLRAFTPLSGRLVYCILSAHNKGASALDITADGRTLVSGGCEGQVRVWDILPRKQSLKKVLKEHKSPVSSIMVAPGDREAVSAGTDGSCIIWDLVNLCRRQVLYANTLFECVCYEPGGTQLLTGGTDRRVSYWEACSGSLARELVASASGAVNALHVNCTGELFATGAADQLVKLWRYQDGTYRWVGTGHAAAVTAVAFSPDSTRLVSACAAGSVIIWNVPASELAISTKDKVQSPKAVVSTRSSPHIPHKPDRTEDIATMDTARDSVVAACPAPEPAATAAPPLEKKSSRCRCYEGSGDTKRSQ